MGVRSIFECQQDGPSVIIWEGGKGTRITYWTPRQAEVVAEYLTERSNQFHQAKEQNEQSGAEDATMVSLVFYSKLNEAGEPKTDFQFIRDFINKARKNGYEVENTLTRKVEEYW